MPWEGDKHTCRSLNSNVFVRSYKIVELELESPCFTIVAERICVGSEDSSGMIINPSKEPHFCDHVGK